MPDSRFYDSLGPLTVAELAATAGARLSDDRHADHLIAAVAPLVRAGAGDVGFFSDKRYIADLTTTHAGAVFITEAQAGFAPEGCAVLITPEPQAAYARAANRLHQVWRHTHGSPPIHPDAEIEDGVILGPGVVVGQKARIGAGTEIGANAVIGPGVCIGRNCRVGANATIGFALIGVAVGVALRGDGWEALLAVPAFVFGALLVTALALLWRGASEFYVAVFRIADELTAVRQRLDQLAEAPAPPVASPVVTPGPAQAEPRPLRNQAQTP